MLWPCEKGQQLRVPQTCTKTGIFGLKRPPSPHGAATKTTFTWGNEFAKADTLSFLQQPMKNVALMPLLWAFFSLVFEIAFNFLSVVFA